MDDSPPAKHDLEWPRGVPRGDSLPRRVSGSACMLVALAALFVGTTAGAWVGLRGGWSIEMLERRDWRDSYSKLKERYKVMANILGQGDRSAPRRRSRQRTP